MNYILKCLACKEEYSDCEQLIYRCEKCGGSLEIIYDYNKIAQRVNAKILEERKPEVWKYKELLPVKDNSKIVT